MQAIIDKELCTGCGLCESICPAVFEMAEDKAIVKANPVPDGEQERVKEAKESCPLEAISIK